MVRTQHQLEGKKMAMHGFFCKRHEGIRWLLCRRHIDFSPGGILGKIGYKPLCILLPWTAYTHCTGCRFPKYSKLTAHIAAMDPAKKLQIGAGKPSPDEALRWGRWDTVLIMPIVGINASVGLILNLSISGSLTDCIKSTLPAHTR